jgi:hypothetical protein
LSLRAFDHRDIDFTMNVAIANNATRRRAAFNASKQRLIALGIDAILQAKAEQAQRNVDTHRVQQERNDVQQEAQEGCCSIM